MTNLFIDEVNDYIDSHFTTEFASSLRAALFVFEAFEYQKLYSDLADVLYDFEADQTDLTSQKFVSAFQKALDEILEHHQVKLNDDVEITKKSIVLGVLYRLQYLEDPTQVLKILETLLSSEEKLSLIIDLYSDLSQVEVLEAIETVSEESLKTLSEYLYKQEELFDKLEDREIAPEALSNLYENLKAFFVSSGTDNLAHNMSENGIVPGFSFEIYLPFVHMGIRGETNKQTALNIFSLFCYSQDTFQEPLKALHQYMEELQLFGETAIAVEKEMQELINHHNGYRKASDVAREVSSTSHQG